MGRLGTRPIVLVLRRRSRYRALTVASQNRVTQYPEIENEDDWAE
jgi:hypothetical protein